MYNIVILNGSPKRDSNTSMLANHFVEGARNAGHMVTHFHLHEMFIHPCNGCMKGGQDEESPCVQIDDMRPIYKAFLNSDMIVLASPMYYWSFSAQLKVAIDRMFAIAELSPNWKSPCKSWLEKRRISAALNLLRITINRCLRTSVGKTAVRYLQPV